jgi:hypothetical protein
MAIKSSSPLSKKHIVALHEGEPSNLTTLLFEFKSVDKRNRSSPHSSTLLGQAR